MRILVVGAGATGGYFGARLAQAGRDVTFLVRAERAERLRQKGLRIIGLGEETVLAPHLVQAGEIESPFDLVLLSVKATGLEQAVVDMAPAVGLDTLIVPVLNGLHHIDLLSARFGSDAVLGGVAKVMTTVDAEGDIVRLADIQSLRYGARRGTVPARLAELDGALGDAGFSAGLSTDIDREMWSKWVFIASVSAVTCLMRGAVGEVAAVPKGAAFAEAVVGECASVAAAAGHSVPDAAKQQTLASVTALGSPMTSSLYRDLTDGRATEVEHVFGDLVERAHRFNVSVPLLELVTMHLRVHENRLKNARPM
ncbi:ketopantoate reductase family protein [Streptomyces sp. NPDC059582]|uniref:ketopantoate reductase family protein n=1 Tax=Streptomyces sp. NPDC059582 TaxID=3346875 RepID=UPI0036B77072